MEQLYKTLLGAWKQRKLPAVIERDIAIEQYASLNPPKITVISGFRRTGKTYLLFQLINKLGKEKCVYLNFEDERIPRTTEFLTNLLPAITAYYGPIEYLFLDEIHVMPQWSIWLRRVYDTEKIRFFVTGSSSKMSSKEIPTELRGRFMEIRVFPLDFREFLRFRTAEKNASENLLLEEYLTYGGLPEVVLIEENKKIELLQNYYNTVIRRDIIERFRIRSEENLKALLNLLLSSTQYTISRLYNSLKSVGYGVSKSTLQTFLGYIETAYLAYSVPVFSPKVKEQMQWPRKIYFIDTGFTSQLSGKFSKNLGRLYENLAFLQLRREGDGRDIFYWKNKLHEEVDFVVKQGIAVKQLIQVCYDLDNIDTRKREERALLKASSELRCRNLLIITEREEGIRKKDGKIINYIPLIKWLREKKTKAMN
ncbi:MAG TPA: ATP-binding protein [Candidatus Nanoarchaeia archaeon]|nr:ATP-binding protein [Candidatus Nanoarchaeia archaeon]